MRTEIKERLRRSRDWVLAIDELEQEAEVIEDKAERSQVLFEIGAASEEVVPERDRALAIYQRAWKLHPENVQALSRAREVYKELGRLDMVAKVGEMELKLRQGDPSLAAVVGEAMLDCGQRERAVEVLQLALDGAPDDNRVKDALAAANYDPEAWMEDVERLTEESERSDSVLAARMLLRAARIVRLEDPDNELYEKLLKQSLANDPQNDSANFLYEALLSGRETWDELEEHHGKRIYAAAEDAEKAELARVFALEWVQRFHDRERAAKFFAQAIAHSTQNGASSLTSMVAAFSLFKDTFGARKEWQQILDLADKVVDRIDGDQRLFVALQSGLIAWKELADVDKAKEYFKIVGELEPESPHLSDFNSEFKNGDTGDQEASAQAEESTEKERSESSSQSVAQAVPEEDLPEEAVAQMDSARQAESNGADQAVDAWRQVVHQFPKLRAPRREYARVLREAERWPVLVEALKDEETKAASTDAERVAILLEVVDVYRQMGKVQMGLSPLTQAHKLCPEDVAILDVMVETYTELNRWPDLVQTLAKKAPLVEDPEERAAMYLQIANLYLDRFSNQAEAIKAFEKVLEIDPDNEQAIGNLVGVYERRRDWEKLIALKEREVAKASPADQPAKIYDIAKLAATKVKKPDVCMHWWEQVLEHDPGNQEAIDDLTKLYERGRHWDKLAKVCEVKADTAADDKEQVAALQKLGMLYTDKAENPTEAISAWKRLLAIDPGHRRAQDSLKKLYVAAGEWDSLEAYYREQGKIDEFVRVLERQLDSVDADAQTGTGHEDCGYLPR